MDKMSKLPVSYGYVGFCLSVSKCGKTSFASGDLFTVSVE